jgi:hypothetical protein
MVKNNYIQQRPQTTVSTSPTNLMLSKHLNVQSLDLSRPLTPATQATMQILRKHSEGGGGAAAGGTTSEDVIIRPKSSITNNITNKKGVLWETSKIEQQ